MKGYWAVLVLALGVLACSVGSSAPSGDRPPESAPTQAVALVAVVPTPVYVPPECEGRPLPTIESTLVVPSTQASGANPPLTTEAQLDVLIGLENAVLENYVYRDFNGLDWPEAVAEIRARVESGMDSGGFYSELQPLIQRLGDEHSYFQSPAEVNSERLGQLNFVGIGALLQARLEKGIITVLDVFPESPADHAGLRPHDIILTIDGKPGVENGGRRGTLGPACTQVVLTIQTPGQSPRQVAIVRDAVSGTLPMDEGLVPTTDGSRIGYLFLPSFLDETISGRVEQALQAFGPLDGLILDNRVNGGGLGSTAESMLALFTEGSMGYYVDRQGQTLLTIEPHPVHNSQTVPLVVLIGEDTVSYGEVLSGVLQDVGRATLIGQATKGNVEQLHAFDFSDGSRAWLAAARFTPLISGANWDAAGVQPDVVVEGAWEDFTSENDPGVAAAIELLRGD